MAANKFATMLHRNTNKITLILIYAILEWILILLLLLNSLFSYVIIKFADYFGLKRPCLWCSRLEHLFDPTKNKNCYRDLVCDAHATEISKLGFCSSHRKLAESQDMCEDCSSSSQPELSKNFAFFPWMKQIGMIQGGGCGDDKMVENGEEVDFKCSCCGVKLEEKIYSPCLLIKPSWGVLDYTQEGNLIKEAGVIDPVDDSDQSRSDYVLDHREDEQMIEESKGIQMVPVVDGGLGGKEEEEFSCFVSSFDCKEMVDNEDGKVDLVIGEEQEGIKEDDFRVSIEGQSFDQTPNQVGCSKKKSPEILPNHIEFYIDQDDCHLIPVELMDSATPKNKGLYKYLEEGEEISGDGDVILDFDVHIGTQVDLVVENRYSYEETVELHERKEEPEDAVLESIEINADEKENSSAKHEEEGDLIEHGFEQVAITQATRTLSNGEDDFEASAAIGGEEMDTDVHQVQACDDVLQMQNDETDAEISIGTEIPDHESIEEIDDIPTQESLPQYSGLEESSSTSSAQLLENDDHGSKQAEEILEFKTCENAIDTCIQSASDLHEIEEERIPDTPTSIDSFHQLHKRLLLLERKESGMEDSLDGSSVISDIEGGDGVLTTEKLKSALKSERKALNALYAELEEERNASAVAANQTMAMINRLQEEKAAMQMEALQYQRMMEEQSEYDQEALQILNEFMVKREKENAELEKELEICRKKLHEFEAKEQMLMLRRRRDGSFKSRTSSASYSINAEDSDGLSVDLNQEPKEEDSFYNHQDSTENQNTPADAVLYLEDSLSNFEEERLSILEQLKVLELKLFTLNDEEDQYFEDIKPIEHFHEENGNGHIEDFNFRSEANGAANGHSKEMNGKHHQERIMMVPKAKRLLPLFDAIDAEIEDGELNGNHHEDGLDSVASQNSSVTKFEIQNKRVAVEEEVDHVYERLLALEADREFLKHCISSLRKGDKGIYLLQEILQHLRDLRSVEVRVKNMGDGAL